MGDQVSERDGAVAQLERGRQIPVGAIVDAHNAVDHRLRQNEPSENIRYSTEPEVGIAIGTLFAVDHLRAEAEDLWSGFCDKAYDEARRLVERPSGDAERRPSLLPAKEIDGSYLHSAFLTTAARDLGLLAILLDDGEAVTYGQLNARSDFLAHRLQQGATAESVIGIALGAGCGNGDGVVGGSQVWRSLPAPGTNRSSIFLRSRFFAAPRSFD
jgi:hypothetical protein